MSDSSGKALVPPFAALSFHNAMIQFEEVSYVCTYIHINQWSAR